MNQETSASLAGEIMTDFARLTGLSRASRAPRRYLWTDAFAVCNYLGLYQGTGTVEFKDLSLQLVDQVHSVLGRHRPDDSRTGWISGLGEEQGKLNPTRGGLRIGKELAERKRGDPLDERLEWDRDGQYYHYLAKWMHALNCVTRVTGEFTYNRWAIELARTAHRKFIYGPSSGRRKRMYWKMSIDLSYPLVPSMGLHDPLDGLVSYSQLQATAAEDPEQSEVDLSSEITEMAEMCEGKNWVTDDPLGIGGLLCDAFRVAQLMARGYSPRKGLLAILVDASLTSLEAFVQDDLLKLPADDRLAFRELGLSIGLWAAERLAELVERNEHLFDKGHELKESMKSLARYGTHAESINRFWLKLEHQEAETWIAHLDINMVMLATSLYPNGYLMI